MYQKRLVNIILVLVAVVLAGAVVYFVLTIRQEIAPQTTQQPVVQPSTPTPTDQTANWKTLRDSFNEVTYEFKLPSDFDPQDANPTIWRLFANNKYSFQVYVHPQRSDFSLEKTLTNMDAVSNTIGEGGASVLSRQNITVNGLPAIQRKENVIYNPFSTAQVVSTYILVNRHLVALTIKSAIDTNPDPRQSQTAPLTASDIEFYSKVLSTFKFTNSQPNSSPATSTATDEWKIYNHSYYDGIVLTYPADWKLLFDYSESDPLFLTSVDYQKDKSGASVNVIIGLTDNRFDWQGTVAAMYGSNSKNELTTIEGKTVFRTTYNDPKIEGISIPISNGKAFISFFLKSQLSTKDEYISVLYDIVKRAQLPNTIPDAWQTYRNRNYGFTFSHPPFTEVKESSQQNLLVFVRYGFHQSLSVNSKPSNESLYLWYTKRLKPDELKSKRIIEKKISGYDGLEVTEEVMAGIIRTTLISKGDLVVSFNNDGLDSLESNLPADNQRLIESLRFK